MGGWRGMYGSMGSAVLSDRREDKGVQAGTAGHGDQGTDTVGKGKSGGTCGGSGLFSIGERISEAGRSGAVRSFGFYGDRPE